MYHINLPNPPCRDKTRQIPVLSPKGNSALLLTGFVPLPPFVSQILLVDSWGGVYLWTTSHHSSHSQAVGAGGPASHAQMPCHRRPWASNPLGFTRWPHRCKFIPDQLLQQWDTGYLSNSCPGWRGIHLYRNKRSGRSHGHCGPENNPPASPGRSGRKHREYQRERQKQHERD